MSALTKPKQQQASRTILTDTHVGQDVPLELAKPFVIARVLRKVKITERGCWEWQGGKNHQGYGQLSFQCRKHMVHRLMYELHAGIKLPADLQACHRCDNPPCVNPDHIFVGDRKTNMSDCLEKGRHFLAERTTCKRGHALEGDNLKINTTGARVCVLCARARWRMNHGWPEDLAFSLPPHPGNRPPHATEPKPVQKGRPLKTHCIHGHPMSGDNVVVTADGRRRCRACNAADARRRFRKRTGQQVAVGTDEG